MLLSTYPAGTRFKIRTDHDAFRWILNFTEASNKLVDGLLGGLKMFLTLFISLEPAFRVQRYSIDYGQLGRTEHQ